MRQIPLTTERQSRPFARPIPRVCPACADVMRASPFPPSPPTPSLYKEKKKEFPFAGPPPVRELRSCWAGFVTIHTLARTCLITEPAAHAAHEM